MACEPRAPAARGRGRPSRAVRLAALSSEVAGLRAQLMEVQAAPAPTALAGSAKRPRPTLTDLEAASALSSLASSRATRRAPAAAAAAAAAAATTSTNIATNAAVSSAVAASVAPPPPPPPSRESKQPQQPQQQSVLALPAAGNDVAANMAALAKLKAHMAARVAAVAELTAPERHLLVVYFSGFNIIHPLVEVDVFLSALEDAVLVGLLARRSPAAVRACEAAFANESGVGEAPFESAAAPPQPQPPQPPQPSPSLEVGVAGVMARVSSLSASAASAAREREPAAALVCFHAILAHAASCSGVHWEAAARAQSEAALAAPAGALLAPSQHAVSALALLSCLSFGCGDSLQAAALSASAWALARPESMPLTLCTLARAYALLHACIDAGDRMAPPPPPLLLGAPGVTSGDAARSAGEALAFLTWSGLRGAEPTAPAHAHAHAPAHAPVHAPAHAPVGLVAMAAGLAASWARMLATGRVDEASASLSARMLSPAYAAVLVAAHEALAGGDTARAVAAGVALSRQVAALGELAAHALMPLLLGVRLLPLLRAAGEAAAARTFTRALLRSAIYAPGLFHSKVVSGGALATLGDDALGDDVLSDDALSSPPMMAATRS